MSSEEETPMDTSMIPTLLERLEKLERSNRRLKLAGLALVVALAAIGVMGQARPPLQTVEAQEFVVKDAGGVVRARLGASQSAASLNLFHEGGRASLVVSGGRGQGAHLAVADAAGKVKGLLLLSPETVGLYLSPVDATGPPKSPRVVFEVLNQGTGGFAFYDRNGQTRMLLGAVADDGSSTAIILDASGKPAWKAP
jgi:hypothetical protein